MPESPLRLGVIHAPVWPKQTKAKKWLRLDFSEIQAFPTASKKWSGRSPSATTAMTKSWAGRSVIDATNVMIGLWTGRIGRGLGQAQNGQMQVAGLAISVGVVASIAAFLVWGG